jgi:hypothetical protein
LAGSAPGPGQRKIIVDAMRARGLATESQRSVILTDSSVVRGAATALSWLTGADTHTFATVEIERAVACAAFDDPVLARRIDAYLWRCMTLLALRRPA